LIFSLFIIFLFFSVLIRDREFLEERRKNIIE